MDMFTQNSFAGGIALSIIGVLCACFLAMYVYRKKDLQNTIAAIGLVVVVGLGMVGFIGQFVK